MPTALATKPLVSLRVFEPVVPDFRLFLILLPHWLLSLLEAPHQDYMRRKEEVEPGRYPGHRGLPVNPASPAAKPLYDVLLLELQS